MHKIQCTSNSCYAINHSFEPKLNLISTLYDMIEKLFINHIGLYISSQNKPKLRVSLFYQNLTTD
jgi:hypothetical protein